MEMPHNNSGQQTRQILTPLKNFSSGLTLSLLGPYPTELTVRRWTPWSTGDVTGEAEAVRVGDCDDDGIFCTGIGSSTIGEAPSVDSLVLY
jgi:hypothetical protein